MSHNCLLSDRQMAGWTASKPNGYSTDLKVVLGSEKQNSNISQQALHYMCLKKSTLMLHTVTSTHINRFS